MPLSIKLYTSSHFITAKTAQQTKSPAKHHPSQPLFLSFYLCTHTHTSFLPISFAHTYTHAPEVSHKSAAALASTFIFLTTLPSQPRALLVSSLFSCSCVVFFFARAARRRRVSIKLRPEISLRTGDWWVWKRALICRRGGIWR